MHIRLLRILIVVTLLIFNFQSLTKADDIGDFLVHELRNDHNKNRELHRSLNVNGANPSLKTCKKPTPTGEIIPSCVSAICW